MKSLRSRLPQAPTLATGRAVPVHCLPLPVKLHAHLYSFISPSHVTPLWGPHNRPAVFELLPASPALAPGLALLAHLGCVGVATVTLLLLFMMVLASRRYRNAESTDAGMAGVIVTAGVVAVTVVVAVEVLGPG